MTYAPRACMTVLAIVWPALGFAAAPESAAAPVAPVATAPIASATAAPAAAVAPAKATVDGTAKLNETQQYCQNIAAAAADARFAWQRKRLTDLEGQLTQRIADLEAREAAFRDFLAHRDDVMKQATDTVVGIYSHMKPDAAAKQIAALDDELAAAILTKLSQKQASIILNEVDPDRAVKLINTMTTNVAGKKS